MKQLDNVTFLGWILVFVLALYFFLVTIPNSASAGRHPKEEPAGKLIFEMEARELRVFMYQDDNVRCYISVVEVSMIGLQTAISCVKRNAPTYQESLPLTIPGR